MTFDHVLKLVFAFMLGLILREAHYTTAMYRREELAIERLEGFLHDQCNDDNDLPKLMWQGPKTRQS